MLHRSEFSIPAARLPAAFSANHLGLFTDRPRAAGM